MATSAQSLAQPGLFRGEEKPKINSKLTSLKGIIISSVFYNVSPDSANGLPKDSLEEYEYDCSSASFDLFNSIHQYSLVRLLRAWFPAGYLNQYNMFVNVFVYLAFMQNHISEPKSIKFALNTDWSDEEQVLM